VGKKEKSNAKQMKYYIFKPFEGRKETRDFFVYYRRL